MKRFTMVFLVGLNLACAIETRGQSVEWGRQLGARAGDFSYGVSADGLGNVFISGLTNGSLGGPNAGRSDAFVGKYDDAGNLLWTRQLGTTEFDLSIGVSADGLGNVFVFGYSTGGLGGEPNAGDLDVFRAFVSKYDDAGSHLWTRQLGTAEIDLSVGVSADGLGNVYISGYSTGGLGGGPNPGDLDVFRAFVSKYDDAGNLLWTRPIGTTSNDFSGGVSADGLGNLYVSGESHGSMGGPNAGRNDAFVIKYDDAGSLLWARQLGTTVSDISFGVSADGLGNVFISGYTDGSLGGANAGGSDAFVAKLSDLTVPEPSTLAIVATCIIGFAVRKQKTSPSATAGSVAVGWHC